MISKLVSFILAAGLCFSASAMAESVTVNVTGRGATHQSAVIDGLQQAVAQVTGITVNVKSLYALQENIADTVADGVQTGHSQLSQATQSDIKSQINGFISGYTVLSSQKNEEGLYLVEMAADIEKYNAPGTQSNRYGLAVVGIKSNCGSCFGGRLCVQSAEKDMTKALVRAFTATRKFSVLDRDEQRAYNIEKEHILSDSAARHESAKLGNVQGTDFMLTGEIKNINIWKKSHTIELTGETSVTQGASATFEYKILVFATRQVKVASAVNVSLSAQETSQKGCADILNMLVNKIADKVAQDSIANIYPTRIVNVKGDNVYINMGGESVQIGNTYGVYAVGEELIDPYTGESLGEEETRIGLLQISAVKPKYSVGKIIEGSIERIEPNQICRPEKKAVKPIVKKTAPKEEPQPDYSLRLN